MHPGDRLAEIMKALGYVHPDTGEPHAEDFSRAIGGAITSATLRNYLTKRTQLSHAAIHALTIEVKAKPSIFFEEVVNAGSQQEEGVCTNESSTEARE